MLCIALLAAAACAGPRVVTVPVGAGSAHVEAGEVLQVDLGEVNPSIGDAWFLVHPPDAAVLGEGEESFESECDEPGCGGRATWTFTARSPGTTRLEFRYCYRSRPDDCQPQPDRGPSGIVALTVTVGNP
jgi:predicted secreted protein